MTQPFDDEHGDRLHRALHAEAEAVTPSAEGLELIRSKITRRHERRLGFVGYSAPWLRPLVAVIAALAVCFTAVSITPALANFVQTGHFSPDSSDGGGAAQNNGRSHGQVVPGESSPLVTGGSPSPSSPRPSSTDKDGNCPPGQVTVSPATSPPPVADHPGPVVCQVPPGQPGGGATSSPPVTEPPPPATSSVPEDPPADPASDSPPPAAVDPNQSP